MKQHTTTETRYPKSSPAPSDSHFTRQGPLPRGNPSKTEYPKGGSMQHAGSDKVRVTEHSKGGGSPTALSYSGGRKTFKNEKVTA